MSKEILSYEVDDAVGVVTIDRPPVNALRYQDLEALTDLLDSLPREDERVIALTTGGDRTFSAGHDVTEFREYDPDAASYRDEVYMNLLETVYDHPLPIVVGVDGPAVGAAAIIASLCDLRVASAGASFAIPEITVGIVGGYGPLRRLLPDGVARHMLYTGNPLPADRAYDLGMVSELVEDPRERAVNLATNIASKSPDAVNAARAVVRECQPAEPIEEYRLERDHIAELRQVPNTQEAAAAFLEDRDPEFGPAEYEP
ncbi:enoyl-CoA hydratase/isomerase family protein [Saliphagus sp. GCM10025317]